MNFNETLQRFAEVAAVNGDAFKSIYGVALNTTERVYSLNTDYARSMLQRLSPGEASTDFPEQVRQQLRQFEQVGSYFRDISEIFVASQAEALTLSSANAEEFARWLAAELEKQFLEVPKGQSAYSEVLQSALNAASNTYAKFMDTSRQLTQSGLAASGKAVSGALKKAA